MRSRGFTLIECIIATFVLAVGFLAVASMYPMAYRGAALNANHVAALQMASATLSEVRASAYGTALPARVTEPVTLIMTVEGLHMPVTFTREITFQRGGSVANPNALSDVARVTVSWDEGTGGNSAGRHKSITVTGGIFREP